MRYQAIGFYFISCILTIYLRKICLMFTWPSKLTPGFHFIYVESCFFMYVLKLVPLNFAAIWFGRVHFRPKRLSSATTADVNLTSASAHSNLCNRWPQVLRLAAGEDQVWVCLVTPPLDPLLLSPPRPTLCHFQIAQRLWAVVLGTGGVQIPFVLWMISFCAVQTPSDKV